MPDAALLQKLADAKTPDEVQSCLDEAGCKLVDDEEGPSDSPDDASEEGETPADASGGPPEDKPKKKGLRSMLMISIGKHMKGGGEDA